jgi:hypothetical protein
MLPLSDSELEDVALRVCKERGINPDELVFYGDHGYLQERWRTVRDTEVLPHAQVLNAMMEVMDARSGVPPRKRKV